MATPPRNVIRKKPVVRSLTTHAGVLTFSLVFPTLGTWLYFQVFAGTDWMQAVYVATKLIQFALPVVWCALVAPAAFGWPRFRREQFAAALCFGIAVAVGMLLGYFAVFRGSSLLAGAPAELAAKLTAAGVTTPGRFLVLAIFYCLVHSLLEEYYWRWFVFGQFRRILGRVTAALISSLGFMAHHVILVGAYIPDWRAAVVFSLAVAVGGFVWAIVYDRSRSLIGPWLSHLLVDAALMILGYDLAFRLAQ